MMPPLSVGTTGSRAQQSGHYGKGMQLDCHLHSGMHVLGGGGAVGLVFFG